MEVALKDGVMMPRLALGTHRLRGTEDLRRALEPALVAPGGCARGDQRDNHARVPTVHIDTASCYRNEAEIADVLWDQLEVPRERVFITTKCSPREMADVRAAVARSRAALRVEVIDMVLLHWPGIAGKPPSHERHARARADAWRALEGLRAEGVVRAIGVSNFEERHLRSLMETAEIIPAVNQIELHPLLRRKELVRFCGSHGIAVCAYSPLGCGALLRHEGVAEIAAEAEREPLGGDGDRDGASRAAEMLVRWSLMRTDAVAVRATGDKHVGGAMRALESVAALGEDALPAGAVRRLDGLDEGCHFCWEASKVA